MFCVFSDAMCCTVNEITSLTDIIFSIRHALAYVLLLTVVGFKNISFPDFSFPATLLRALPLKTNNPLLPPCDRITNPPSALRPNKGPRNKNFSKKQNIDMHFASVHENI